ncbi:MAG: DUF5615 family PIN-like protein [Verrucomicrobiota bacterium]
MKFLVDAQLPEQLALKFQKWGYDAIHTRYLNTENSTTDRELLEIANKEERILVTRDENFIESMIFKGAPSKLLFISNNSLDNSSLVQLIDSHMEYLKASFDTHRFVEIS